MSIAELPSTPSNEGPVERENAQPLLAVGQWYWIKNPGDDEADDKGEWFGCIMAIGSNYVRVQSPGGGYQRIHFDNVLKTLRHEPDAEGVIRRQIVKWSDESRRLLGEVKEITARLGLKTAGALPATRSVSDGTELVVMSGQTDIAAYKAALIEAKDKTLPELFKGIKRANEKMTQWMTANTLPLTASVESMEGAVGDIKDRIFNVSLYAGLVEDAKLCSDGAPANMDDKLHVMQRRLYMDEECLLNYDAGGMEFANIGEFDAWIARPENRDRILPFARTLVAMRVRRFTKGREWDGSLLGAYINVKVEQADKLTFLYIRNGEQVWRISCEMEFEEMIFPDKAIYDPSEPMMVKMFCDRVDEMITRREYDQRYAEWKVTPKADRWHHHFRPDEWKPFDQSNVYFDDCMASVANEIKEYNRIAVIIQGLFDRSQVLHPHPTVRAWTPEGFDRAIRLVYDAHMVLDNGDPPDFEAYRARCNESLGTGSITTGQDAYWQRIEAEKEKKRRRHDYRLAEAERYRELSFWRPYGNPGPGSIAIVQEWKPRAKRATFVWTRKKQRYDPYGDDEVRVTLSVPPSELLNVSVYTPGDFKQFFADHRTRERYMQWAPLLLAAEDYHAGRLRTPQPGPSLE